ncbi:hypothetical protein E1A91_D11G359600v1 [Gossypium mustelinum]|uniref:TIR domain-containing protein n=1 Tax=Gossypium mustelinum TaxID=34275 RepID=A0A5D2T1D4_GOSMU|nr:hypothetical protein E1A91_D11G359600v1 [Gossypium mustelinum]
MLSLPSTSSSISKKIYDVFLSFRGEDTRNNFTDHLYNALKRRGIVTFRDDPKLEAGEEIAPELFEAIQQSWCSIIVFAKTYAFSSWCLEELADIVKQKKDKEHKVYPIFYEVDPSDLRKQKEKVEAFAKHEERYKEDGEKIQKWRNALREVANIKGWHLNNRHESEFIQDIAKKISVKLCQTYTIVHYELIGINLRICEMGGIGKTTLARIAYTQMSLHFEGKTFLADVREVSDKCGLVSLQKQLLSQILLDECFNFLKYDNKKKTIAKLLTFNISMESNKILNLSVDTFLKMKKLRLLKVLCLSNCDDLKYLSNELRLLDWTEYPLRYLPSSFQPDNLVALLLPYSHIQQLRKGNRPLFNLKIMNLRGSQNLIKTPDFTTASNLEVLILEGCTKLVDVHPSIRVLKSLKLLNLRDCKSLRTLPTKIGMESLETLILSGCSSLVRFPEINWKMERLKTLDLSGCYRVENLLENLQQAKFLEELDLSETAIAEPPSFIFQFKNLKLLPSLPSLFKVIQGRRTNPMGRMLPLLSGLSSLRELKLRDCNLCEGDIPPDISGLSCLEILDLSGNNFVSIPASLTRLSKLAYLILSNCNLCTFGEADTHSDISGLSSLSYLNLSGCKMLKSLPELPTSIGSVTIDDCSSLELVASPSKVCNLVGGESIDAINCFKLAEKINALALLKEHIKALPNSRKYFDDGFFDIMMPGSEIPEWFSQQKSDFSIKIPLPINLRKDSQWIGVACCCIFVNNDASRGDEFISCEGSIFRGRNCRRICWRNRWVGRYFDKPIMKDHLFLRYFPRDQLYPISLEDKYGDCETNNLWTTDCFDQIGDELELSFNPGIGPNFPCVKVKKCGVRIVYEKDLEEMEELQCDTTQSSPNFEHIHQHSAHNHGSVGPIKKEALTVVEDESN